MKKKISEVGVAFKKELLIIQKRLDQTTGGPTGSKTIPSNNKTKTLKVSKEIDTKDKEKEKEIETKDKE